MPFENLGDHIVGIKQDFMDITELLWHLLKTCHELLVVYLVTRLFTWDKTDN